MLIGLIIIGSVWTGFYFGKGIGVKYDNSAVLERYKFEDGTVLINEVQLKDTFDKLFVADPDLDKDKFFTCLLEIKDYKTVADGLGAVVVLRDRNNKKYGSIHLQINQHDGMGMCEWRLSNEFIVNSEVVYQILPNTENVAFVKGKIGEFGYWKRVNGKVQNFPFDQ